MNTPAQQDEADILGEVGAQPDPDTGQMVADEEKVLEVGALDAASVIENRRMQDIVDKKRGNIKGVFFNTDDVLVKYEQMLKYWPANSTTITMKRVSGGSPVTLVIASQPKSGQELYAAMMAQHGAHDEATYDVKVQDTTTKNFLINGRIMLPDARPPQPPQQGQPPMNPYQPPYGQPAPQYPQQPYAQPQPQPYMQPMQPAPQQGAVAQQPIVQVVPPPQPQAPDPMAMMGQMFKMFSEMQQQAQQAVVAAHPAPQQPAHPVPQQPVMQPLPPPPQTSDPAVMMGWMQQMFGLFQQMQQQLAQQRSMPQVQQQQPPPAPAQQPPDPMAMMGQFFKMFMDMQQAASATVRQTQAPAARGPYLGPRPDSQQPYPQQYQPPYAQPARQKTAAEQFRENVTEVRSFAEALQDLGTIFPGQQPPAAAAAERDDREEDAPVKVMEVGDHKLVLDNRDGSVRKYETVVANLTPIMKWLGEQREAIQKANEQKKQQLPPGYVEVGPGYVPPPGFVAVPVDQIPQQHQQPALQQPTQQASPQPDLPQAPAQMFAQPLPAEETQPKNRTWEAPGGN